MGSMFFRIGIAIGVVLSIAAVTWPRWKPDWLSQAGTVVRDVAAPLVASPEPVVVELKTWTDKNGVVHFSNDDDAAPAKAGSVTVDTGKIMSLPKARGGNTLPDAGQDASFIEQQRALQREQQRQREARIDRAIGG